MKRIAIVGASQAGSWQMRGVQLGAAMGVSVSSGRLPHGRWDVVVLVKRVPASLVAAAHAAAPIVIWDAVDFWPQPLGNAWGRAECMATLRAHIAAVRPRAVVGATRAMTEDILELGTDSIFMPHHARPDQPINPVRDRVATVGYEGSESYITGWRSTVEAECKRRGWAFVVNPRTLSGVDICLALRDASGYGPRQWKSAVKLSNAQATGTPFVGVRERGYIEQSIGSCERWADSPKELARAFDELTPVIERQRVSSMMRCNAPKLEDVAIRYASWLSGLS